MAYFYKYCKECGKSFDKVEDWDAHHPCSKALKIGTKFTLYAYSGYGYNKGDEKSEVTTATIVKVNKTSYTLSNGLILSFEHWGADNFTDKKVRYYFQKTEYKRKKIICDVTGNERTPHTAVFYDEKQYNSIVVEIKKNIKLKADKKTESERSEDLYNASRKDYKETTHVLHAELERKFDVLFAEKVCAKCAYGQSDDDFCTKSGRNFRDKHRYYIRNTEKYIPRTKAESDKYDQIYKDYFPARGNCRVFKDLITGEST